jgi:EmrB/QacA subfamily drug resistance transporter
MIQFRSRAGRGVLLATTLGSGIAFLDGTVVNVALPAIGSALGGGLAGLQWTVDAYLLTLSALLLVGGSLGDVYGRRRIFVFGLAWFAIASMACGFAPSIEVLIAVRAFQGIGAALLVPGSLAILRSSIREEDQGAAIGAWSGLAGVTTAIGPLLGGWLVTAASWRLIFFINLPLALAAMWTAQRFVPESRDPSRDGRVDWVGGLSAAVALGGIVFALIEARNLSHGTLAAALAIGVASLIAFFVQESRAPSPMLPLGLFRSRGFSGANAVTLAVYFALGGATFLLVLQLQRVLGYSPIEAGASLLPVTFLMLLLSSPMGALAQRIGYRIPMTVGPLVSAMGVWLFGDAAPGASYWSTIFPAALLLGLGLCVTVAPLTTAVLNGVGTEYAGVASGVNNAIARVAGLLAVALLPLWAGMSGANGTDEALRAGYTRAMRLCAAWCAGGGLCGWVTMAPPGRPR